MSTREFLRDERGSVTAEFAVVLPAVVAVLGLVIGGVWLAAHRIALVSIAAELCRAEARGERGAAEQHLARLPAGTTVSRENHEGVLCVTLRTKPAEGLLRVVTLSVESCAAVSEGAA